MATRSADIPLGPLSNDKFDELRGSNLVRKRTGATPELGDRNDETSINTHAYTGRCEQFDLSDPAQRISYAELTAKLYSGAEYIRLWEERMPGDGGKYFVYVTYIQVMSVYQSGNDRFDLSEDR